MTAGRESTGERIERGGLSLTKQVVAPSILMCSWIDRTQSRRPARAAVHGDLELAWVHSGGVRYRVGSRELEAGPGSVIVIPPNVEHATWMTPGTHASSLHMSAELVGGVAEALGPVARTRRLDVGLAEAPDRILRLARLLGEEAADGGPGSTLAAEALAEALAVHVLRGAPQKATRVDGRDPRILRAVQLAEDLRGVDVGVAELARVAGMSRYHFTRQFREATGTTPYRYVLELRLARAAELIRTGHISVTEAAMEAGFNDLGRFASQFRRAFGYLPSHLATARMSRKTAQIA